MDTTKPAPGHCALNTSLTRRNAKYCVGITKLGLLFVYTSKCFNVGCFKSKLVKNAKRVKI